MADDAEHQDLLIAIGRVTMQSAQNDDYLRDVLQELIVSDSAWILTEGQSTEWLCSTLPVILRMEDPHGERWPRPLHEALLAAGAEIKSLHQHRNTVVHSIWTRSPSYSYEDTRPRPWGKRDDSTVWTVFRSRQRTYAPQSEWTVSDVALLADKLCSAGEGLMAAYARMYQHAHPTYEAGSRWESWLELDASAQPE